MLHHKERTRPSAANWNDHDRPTPRFHEGAGHRPGHLVQFCESENFLAVAAADFLSAGLVAEQPLVVIATKPHIQAISRRMRMLGCDVAEAERSGQLTWLDAQDTLASLMTGNSVDAKKFEAVIGGAIGRSIKGRDNTVVRAYGEMVDLLLASGNASAALRLEDLWNELAHSYRFSLLCAYAMDRFADADLTPAFAKICVQHGHVFPGESYLEGDEAARHLEVSLLQQRAQALETELARRTVLEQRIRDAEAELQDCLDHAAEAIHWAGPDGTILWANEAELSMLGYSREEYVGRNVADYHVDRAVIDEMLARLTRGETLRDCAARLRCKDGSIRHVLVNSNVLWRDGDFVHTRCFTRDVTERERLLERERAARAEAEAANRAKSEFLAVMSHELRTPLNAIGGYTELLELGIRGPVTQAQREDLMRIQKSQLHLLGLINEVLNYTRIESGAMVYEISEFALTEALAAVEPLVRPQLAAKKLTLDVEPATCGGPHIVRADRDKLQQIMLNLLSNAAKFTDRGGRITISCQRPNGEGEPTGDPRVIVQVKDTGIGIPPGKLDVVFEPFVQVNTGLTRPHDGTGLGLAISRDLARGMGGELTVESEVGVGSTFTLSLPGSRNGQT